MKPLHVAILVAAGALGGAVVMQVWNRPHPAPVEAQVRPPAAPAAAVVTPPAPAPAPPVESQPAVSQPVPVEPAAPPRKAVRVHRAAPKPRPVVVAKADPPPVVTPPPPVQEPVTQPVSNPQPDTAPQSLPPARTEPEQVTPPPPPPREPHRVTLNTGTVIPVRLVDGLSSERNAPGDTFIATLDQELVADGFVIAERGARVEGRVVSAERAGKVQGVASLAVELTRIHTSDGQRVAVQTERFDRRVEPGHREDATKVGAGAAVGAIIGAIAGGGKGAAIGAGVGGAAGAGDVLLTRGRPATLPSETRISFRLRAPVNITEKLY
jgi:hypothetical protein